MSLVSIIIPAHNYGKYIAETLDSLLAQTHTTWECFVIDDGSVDNTEEVVSRYTDRDSRFQYIYQRCQGVSAARNVGLCKVKGTYIQFLDADDLLLPEKLAIHVAYLEQHTTIDIVYSDVRYFANDNASILSLSFDMQNRDWMPKALNSKDAASYLVQDNLMPIQAPLSRAALIQKVGFFEPNLRHCEDWHYWLRCVEEGGKIQYLDNDGAQSYIRVHPISATHNISAMSAGARVVMDRAYAFMQARPELIDSAVRTDLKRTRALDLIKAGRKISGISLFLNTLSKRHNAKVGLKDVLYWLRK